VVNRQSQSNSDSAKSAESRVEFELGGRQSETHEAESVAPGEGVEHGGVPIVESRCVATLSLVVRQTPPCENVSTGAEERPLLEDVTQRRSEDHD
jgi:hypothetical protein